MSRTTHTAIGPTSQAERPRVQHHVSARLPTYAERGRREDQSMRGADLWAQRSMQAVPNRRAAATVGDTALPTGKTLYARQAGVGETVWRVHQHQTRNEG